MHIDKNKEREDILCEAGVFYTAVQGTSLVFHACDSCMYENAFFKNRKKLSYFLYVFVHLLPVSVFFALFQPYFTLF